MSMDIETQELNIVTGAFGYTGKYITRKLLSIGKRVKTLTGHPNRPNPFGNQVSVAPFHFDNPAELTMALLLFCAWVILDPFRPVLAGSRVIEEKVNM